MGSRMRIATLYPTARAGRSTLSRCRGGFMVGVAQLDPMQIAILHNADHDLLEEDPGREARKDVTRVAILMAEALSEGPHSAQVLSVTGDRLDFLETLQRLEPDLVVNLCESLAADSRGEM